MWVRILRPRREYSVRDQNCSANDRDYIVTMRPTRCCKSKASVNWKFSIIPWMTRTGFSCAANRSSGVCWVISWAPIWVWIQWNRQRRHSLGRRTITTTVTQDGLRLSLRAVKSQQDSSILSVHASINWKRRAILLNRKIIEIDEEENVCRAIESISDADLTFIFFILQNVVISLNVTWTIFEL